MPWHTIKNEVKISAIFRYLTSRQRELRTFCNDPLESIPIKLVISPFTQPVQRATLTSALVCCFFFQPKTSLSLFRVSRS